MRRNIGIITVSLIIIFLGVFTAMAEPGYTIECGGCHTVNSSWNMSANSTGSGTLGIPFALTINASKPNVGGGTFLLSIQAGWADNSNFDFTPTEVEDNTSGDLNPLRFSISIVLTFTPENPGNFTIRAWCATNGGSQSLEIPINVVDPNPPPTTTTEPIPIITPPTTEPSSTQPPGLILSENTIASWGLIIGTWAGMIIIVVVISEVLRRNGRW